MKKSELQLLQKNFAFFVILNIVFHYPIKVKGIKRLSVLMLCTAVMVACDQCRYYKPNA